MFLNKLENILLFLVIIFLPTQLGRHFWPDFSYVYSLPIDYLSPTVYFWDILTSANIICWLLSKPKINSAALNLLFIFLCFQAASVVFAGNIGAGLVKIEQFLISGLFGVYLSSKDGILKKVILPLSIAIIFQSLLAIVQFGKGETVGLWILGERSFSISTPSIAKFNFYGLEFLRPYATFPHPNVLAAFLLIGMILTSSILPFLIGSIALLLTFSRSVILTGILSAFFMLKGKLKTLVLIMVLVLSPILATRFLSLADFDNLTVTRREELLEVSIGMFVRSPLFGIGLNNFIPYSSLQAISGQSRFLQPVHNIYLLSLSEAGVFGFFGLSLLLVFPIKKSLRSRLFIIWMVILFLGLFDHYFLTLPQGHRLLFLVWGLSLARS